MLRLFNEKVGKYSCSCSCSGFTMIDTLLGVVIFLIGIQGLMMLNVNTTRSNVDGEKVTEAAVLAQERIERVKGLTFTKMVYAQGVENYGTIADFNSYRRKTKLKDFIGEPDIKELEVTVYWNADRDSLILTTIVSNVKNP